MDTGFCPTRRFIGNFFSNLESLIYYVRRSALAASTLSVGDHVAYKFLLAFKHHGIVLGVWKGESDEEWKIRTAEFFPDKPFPIPKMLSSARGQMNPNVTNASDWEKIEYEADQNVESPGKVCKRACFLLENPRMHPPYHASNANCECFAVWCKTGTWATKQVLTLLARVLRRWLWVHLSR